MAYGSAAAWHLGFRQAAGLTGISHFERHDALFGAVRTVLHARRSAGIHALLEELIAIPLTSFEDVNFFPEVVHERLRAGASGIDLQHPGDKHALGIFGEDF